MVFTWGAEQKLGTKAIVRMKIVIRKGRAEEEEEGTKLELVLHSHKFCPPVLDFAIPVVPFPPARILY